MKISISGGVFQASFKTTAQYLNVA
jgi:hypothetical protein